METLYKSILLDLESNGYSPILSTGGDRLKKREAEGKEAFMIVEDKDTKRTFKIIVKEKTHR